MLRLLAAAGLLLAGNGFADKVRVTGKVTDRNTREFLACRMYVRDAMGNWHFASHSAPLDKAVHYRKKRGDSEEMHTTLSPHHYTIDLEPGEYAFTIERGKEYLPETRRFTVSKENNAFDFALSRFVNMAERGWYSGDTHVHRTLQELPNIILAEDLNVVFPLTYWVHHAGVAPTDTNRDPPLPPSRINQLIQVDPTHVIYPLNTEYELFVPPTATRRRFMLGAVFVLNHQTPLDVAVPPLGKLVERARAEKALFELDKHNWPWSMALVPLMNVDLFELSNNHVWRSPFTFTDFGVKPPDYMTIEQNEFGVTERGWLHYGFQNYYALLNCGFRLRPTAGTASGVHPVPLGFGRVYVKVDGDFTYDKWVDGLDKGRSFVTTGPMLFATVNGKEPGRTFADAKVGNYRIAGSTRSQRPVGRIEVVVAGKVQTSLEPENRQLSGGGFEATFDATVPVESSTWIAVRCFEERSGGRVRFAHTAPIHIDVPGKPLLPRAEEVDFLAGRVQDEIERSKGVLPREAIAEYQRALEIYQSKRPAD